MYGMYVWYGVVTVGICDSCGNSLNQGIKRNMQSWWTGYSSILVPFLFFFREKRRIMKRRKEEKKKSEEKKERKRQGRK